MKTHKRNYYLLIILLFFMVLGVGFVGTMSIPWKKVFANLVGQASHDIDSEWKVLVYIRLPRVILGAIVGFSLAFCGTVMQGIFRNPLADPYLLGIASGATAGATIAILIGIGTTIFLPLGAFIGGAISVAVAYSIAYSKTGHFSNTSLILAGVAMGALFSSVTTFAILIAENQQLRHILFWMMGSLAMAKWSWIVYILIPLIIVVKITSSFQEQLNALSLGDEMAFHLGIHPINLKRLLLGLTTILTASVVCVCGTIGFVGLIVPHTTRMIFGANHKNTLIASGLIGASFLVGCDILARTVASPNEIPIGVVTSMFGAPFFLYLLIHHKDQRI